jgi:phage host-nuclease inhibitor protein Gam
MNTELLQALGAEVADQMDELREEIRRDFAGQLAEQLAAIQRNYIEHANAFRERLAEADRQRETLQQEVAVLRSQAGAALLTAVLLDADGVLHLVQRNGEQFTARLPDFDALVQRASNARFETMTETLRSEMHANVARTFELFCNAPAWSESAVYTEGQIVQTDVGRTYRVRAGVRAALGRAPGDDVERWERLGTGGFRVLKSRPEKLAAGDMFTEHDARFLHDGSTTILFVPKAAKVSDIERAVKGPHGLAQAAQAEVRDLATQMGNVAGEVARSATAANDASEIGVQALAQVGQLREDVDALQRRLDELGGASAGGAS